MIKEILKEYQHKITKDTWMKSILYGLLSGLVIASLLSIYYYIKESNGIITIILSFIVVSGSVIYILKKYVFTSSIKDIAKTIDQEFELEERVITMVEYENESNIVINKQRENAVENLSRRRPDQIKTTSNVRVFIAIALLLINAVVMMSLTSIKVASQENTPPIIEISPEDEVIEELIQELEDIVENAPIDDELKEELQQEIEELKEEIEQEETLNQKIARVEETKRNIEEKIEEATQGESSIVDELKERETTEDLGEALDDEEQSVEDVIDEMVDDFNQMTPEEQQEYLEQLKSDIEESISDAETSDPSLEETLEELTEQLEELIPELENQSPSESSEQLEEILEELSESLGTEPEEQTQEEIDEAFEEAISELEELLESEQGESEEPFMPTEPIECDPGDECENGMGEDGKDGGDGDGTDVGNGLGTPLDNPLIIDGNTEYTQEMYEQILAEMTTMIEEGLITEEEVILLMNEYLKNIEITENQEETE